MVDLLLESVELRADLGHSPVQLGELCRARLGVAEPSAEATGGFCHFFQLAQHLNRCGLGRRGLLVGLGAKEQTRIGQKPLPHFLRAAQKGRAQLAHLAAAQLSCRDRLGQAPAVFTAAAGNR